MGFLNLDLGLKGLLSPPKEIKNIDWTPKQLEIINSTNRHIIASGGYGSGKTLSSLMKFISWLTPDQKGIATAYSYNTLRKLIEDTLDTLGVDYTFRRSSAEFILDNGTSFYIYGMDTVRSKERIRSLNLSHWFADEVIFQDEDLCREVMSRLRGGKVEHKWIWSTNPSSSAKWILDFVEDEKTHHISFQTSDNPHLEDSYIADLNLKEGSSRYNQMILGKWVPDDDAPFQNAQYESSSTFDYACIDPSMEGKDYTALVLVKKIDDKYICKGFLFTEAWYSVIPRMCNIIKKHNVKKSIIESNITGSSAYEPFKNEGVIIQRHRTSSNKEGRIYNLSGRVALGKVVLDGDSDELFINQVINWTSKAKHDDAPDSISIFFEWFFRTKNTA